MIAAVDRRREKRLRYSWPVWFAEDFHQMLSQGQMVDLNSTGAAFTCYASNCPCIGQNITARFSVPRYDSEDSFELENFIRQGHISRVEQLNPFIRKIAICFNDRLPFKPGEQPDSFNEEKILEEMLV